ncbi:MAG: tetratricopeptide repeat protein [Lachnospiraceae bacterium]|nr:tetratricopeptide repeat protein [Lachnospiraceae bacterium]
MRCFNCGAVLSGNDFCTNCGTDIRIYRRIMRLSNMYYNDGLKKAQVRDLSGAVESLRQSLKCNRNNIDARNLLGLVYFEMGEAVAALSEWVISKNIKPDRNVADDFIEEIQSNPTRLTGINQSLMKYNQALAYCHQESYDLAIIQLKKVLQMNSNLIVAYQLLGLLYLHTGEFGRARKTLENGRKIDKNNTLILSYLREAEAALEERDGNALPSSRRGGSHTRASSESIVYQSGNETIIQPLNTPERGGSSTFLNILIGLAVGIALMWFLVLPARIRSSAAENSDEMVQVSNELTAKSADIDELNKKISSLSVENRDLRDRVEALSGGGSFVETYDILAKAALNYIEHPDDVIATSNILEELVQGKNEEGEEEIAYSDAFNALYGYLNSNVSKKAAEEYTQKGMAAYEGDNYNEAITNLQNSYNIDPTNDKVLYYLASSYRNLGDSDKATELYSSLVNNFPDSEFLDSAKTYLRNGAENEANDQNNNNAGNQNTGTTPAPTTTEQILPGTDLTGGQAATPDPLMGIGAAGDI